MGGYAHHGVVAHHGLGHLGYGYGLGLGHHIVAAPAAEATEERKKRDIHHIPTPVAIGGYVANAGCNGDLCGPTHEVAGLVPALATVTQENGGAVSLTTGAAVPIVPVVHHALPAVHHVGYAGHHGLGYAGHLGLGYLGYAGHHGLGYAGFGLGYHGLLGAHGLVLAPKAEAEAEE